MTGTKENNGVRVTSFPSVHRSLGGGHLMLTEPKDFSRITDDVSRGNSTCISSTEYSFGVNKLYLFSSHY